MAIIGNKIVIGDCHGITSGFGTGNFRTKVISYVGGIAQISMAFIIEIWGIPRVIHNALMLLLFLKLEFISQHCYCQFFLQHYFAASAQWSWEGGCHSKGQPGSPSF